MRPVRTLLVGHLVFFAVMGTLPVRADFQSSARGGAAVPFLLKASGARGSAMGEATVALSDRASALFTNPAGLALLPSGSFEFDHVAGFESINYDMAALAFPAGKKSGWGAGALYSSVGDLQETNESAVNTGTFSPNDLAFVLGYGRRVARWSAGLSAKLIRSQVIETAQTAAVDMGVMSPDFWRNRARIGLAVQNVGGGLTYESEKEDLPFLIKAGARANANDRTTLTFDLAFPRAGAAFVSAGSEWEFVRSEGLTAVARAGYNSRAGRDLKELAGFSGGMGLQLRALAFDYAFVPYGELGDQHHISISYFFGSKRPSKQPEPVKTENNLPVSVSPVPPVKPSVGPTAPVKPAPRKKTPRPFP